jgi:hypothetical protein
VTHYSEDDLTLYYYGDGPSTSLRTGRGRDAVERHLAECASCTATFRSIAGALAMIPASEPPPRGDQYGLEVWQRIRHQLPPQDAPWWNAWLRWDRLALAGAAAVLVLAAFIAGRFSPRTTPAAVPATVATARPDAIAAEPANHRILLTSVAEHLDRSERVLLDIMNAAEHGDISAEQEWAADLVTTSRLYRQDAIDAGEQGVASTLDDLERNLLEIIHSPARISAADLEQIRRRIDAAALLFKVRILSDELHQRDEAPVAPALPRTSTRKTS